MDYRMPGFHVHHQLLEPTQTRVHCFSEPVQPSHPLSFPFPPTWFFPSISVFSSESILCIRWPKYWSFSFRMSLPMNIQDWFPLGWTCWISLQSRDSQESSPVLTSMKGEINNNTIIVGECNIPLTPTDRSTEQKINKETQTLNDTMDH